MAYKFKLEPVRHCESTLKLFGKRGTYWHSTVVFYRATDEEAEYNKRKEKECRECIKRKIRGQKKLLDLIATTRTEKG